MFRESSEAECIDYLELPHGKGIVLVLSIYSFITF